MIPVVVSQSCECGSVVPHDDFAHCGYMPVPRSAQSRPPSSLPRFSRSGHPACICTTYQKCMRLQYA